MSLHRDEQVLYVKDLVFSIFRRWKMILVLVLVAALALGGVKALGSRKAGLTEDQLQAATVQYEAEKERLQASVDRLQNAVDSQREYLELSELMNLDPFGFYQGVIRIYVDTDYHIIYGNVEQEPDKTGRVLYAYQILLKNNDSCKAVAEAIGLDVRYVSELVGVSTGYSQDTQDTVLTIDVWMDDEVRLSRTLEVLSQQLQKNHAHVSNMIVEHTVDVISSDIKMISSSELRKSQDEQHEILEQLTAELDAAKQELDALKAPSAAAGMFDFSVVKYAVVGAVAGGALAVFAAMVLFFVQDKVGSVRAVEERLAVRVIARLPGTRKGIVRGWIDTMEGRVTRNSKAVLDFAAISVASYCGECRKLLVVCPAGVTVAEQVFEKLAANRTDVAVCGSLCHDPAAMEQLAGCDKILLVAQCDRTNFGEMSRQIAVARDLGKKIAGCLLVE
jgi:hypothetical protein